MYYYNIGYYTFEESEYTQLIHKKKYSNNELKEIVEEAYISIMKDKKIGEKRERYETRIQIVNPELIEYLINNKGFNKIEFHAEWCVFGWAHLFEEDWKETVKDKNLYSLREKLKKLDEIN